MDFFFTLLNINFYVSVSLSLCSFSPGLERVNLRQLHVRNRSPTLQWLISYDNRVMFRLLNLDAMHIFYV